MHLQVNAAVLPDGKLVKLDGHTRARLWELRPAIALEKVLVTALYPVDTLEEAALLYPFFDNKAAVDTASDDLSSAYRSVNFVPQSLLLRSYRGTWAIKAATAAMMGRHSNVNIDIFKAVPLWLDQLRALDALNPTPQYFSNGIIAAALVTILRRGQPGFEALDRYQNDAGLKTAEAMDGVEALARLSLTGAGGGTDAHNLAMFGRALSCIEAVCENREFLVAPKARRGEAHQPHRLLRPHASRPAAALERLLREVQDAEAEQARYRRAVQRYILGPPPAGLIPWSGTSI